MWVRSHITFCTEFVRSSMDHRCTKLPWVRCNFHYSVGQCVRLWMNAAPNKQTQGIAGSNFDLATVRLEVTNPHTHQTTAPLCSVVLDERFPSLWNLVSYFNHVRNQNHWWTHITLANKEKKTLEQQLPDLSLQTLLYLFLVSVSPEIKQFLQKFVLKFRNSEYSAFLKSKRWEILSEWQTSNVYFGSS